MLRLAEAIVTVVCFLSQSCEALQELRTAAVSVHGSNWKRLPPSWKGLRHLWKNFHMQKSKIAQMVRGQIFKRGKRQSSVIDLVRRWREIFQPNHKSQQPKR